MRIGTLIAVAIAVTGRASLPVDVPVDEECVEECILECVDLEPIDIPTPTARRVGGGKIELPPEIFDRPTPASEDGIRAFFAYQLEPRWPQVLEAFRIGPGGRVRCITSAWGETLSQAYPGETAERILEATAAELWRRIVDQAGSIRPVRRRLADPPCYPSRMTYWVRHAVDRLEISGGEVPPKGEPTGGWCDAPDPGESWEPPRDPLRETCEEDRREEIAGCAVKLVLDGVPVDEALRQCAGRICGGES